VDCVRRDGSDLANRFLRTCAMVSWCKSCYGQDLMCLWVLCTVRIRSIKWSWENSGVHLRLPPFFYARFQHGHLSHNLNALSDNLYFIISRVHFRCCLYFEAGYDSITFLVRGQNFWRRKATCRGPVGTGYLRGMKPEISIGDRCPMGRAI
jgi:hypothetical protein